jgi:hypothetical protein
MNAPTTHERTFSTAELAFLVCVPAAWAILLLFHPLGDGSGFYEVTEGNVGAWITVHLGMGIFVPLFAGAVLLLLRGVGGTAATVSRAGLAVFAVVYAAWELVLGVGTGILTNEVEALPPAQQALGAELVDSYGESGLIGVLAMVGSTGLAVGIVAAVVALRGAYRLGWASIGLMLAAIPLIVIHEPPFGPAGLVLFIGAVLLFARQHAPVPTPTPTAAPAPGPPLAPSG